MSVDAEVTLILDDSFVRELAGLYEPWKAATAPNPRLLTFNAPLATELGLDPVSLQTTAGVDLLVGNTVVPGSTPVAQAYSGHQFGGFSPRLGDGRALLLGELVDSSGFRRDLHLKGSGRTPFARGGDGKAAVGPMLREFLISEAMHALDIPTTRSLAVVATGEYVRRETLLPGAVLARVAASHLRVGTFQYAAQQGTDSVRRLADYAIARHYPAASDAPNRYLALFEAVVNAQASLIAKWMLVGFIHGVMNTDNMTISGETIDYGPCAFMDTFNPATVFSSIDHQGRYAFGNQPHIATWNLARLAETLLHVIDDDDEAAIAAVTAVLASFMDRFRSLWSSGMRTKLGLADFADGDDELVDELFTVMHAESLDYTSTFRALASWLRGDISRLPSTPRFMTWAESWRARVEPSGGLAVADAMDRVNPIYIPRNHKVEEALAAATAGDLAPFNALVAVLAAPFTERPGLDAYAIAAPTSFEPYQTFCGT